MNSTDVRERWANRTGAYSPDYYAYYGPNETSEAIRERLDAAFDSDATVLELGCSSGRHLAHLLEAGYEDLHGIEINDDAFDVMADAYPELAAEGTFYADAIEDVVDGFADDRFDAVYSVETLQHLHPDDEWVFAELCRITDALLLTAENEGDDGSGDDGDRSGDDDRSSSDGDRSDGPATERDRADGPDVTYVHDEFPLYYRNWRRVFTDLGFVEVHDESVRRGRLRAFRPAGR